MYYWFGTFDNNITGMYILTFSVKTIHNGMMPSNFGNLFLWQVIYLELMFYSFGRDYSGNGLRKRQYHIKILSLIDWACTQHDPFFGNVEKNKVYILSTSSWLAILVCITGISSQFQLHQSLDWDSFTSLKIWKTKCQFLGTFGTQHVLFCFSENRIMRAILIIL